jgi:predicted nucleic acid-binding protein
VIVIDTGFLLALLDAGDGHHAAAMRWQHSIAEGWITTWPVATELCHLVANRLGSTTAIACMQELTHGGIRLWDVPALQARQIPVLMKRYANLPMDLADASLVLLAGHLGHGRILTTDERDFGSYRWKDRKPFRNLLSVGD